MLYFTGDTHGDFSRFRHKRFPEQEGLTKEDYVLICGDFGGVWNRSKEQRFWLDWLDEKPYTTLFVTGNHENYDLLSEFPVSSWRGGQVQRIRPSVLHLMRGQIFDIDGKRIFTMGGASCHDIPDGVLDPADPLFRIKKARLDLKGGYYRVNHQSWWKEELPSPEEYETARRNLDRAGWSVDYVVSHCAPTTVQEKIADASYKANDLTDFLEAVARRCKFRYWLFGHYHANLILWKKYILLYEQIIRLREEGEL